MKQPFLLNSISVCLALITLYDLSTKQATAQPSGGRDAVNLKEGVSINDPHAFNGYTLIAPMNATSTYLIDMQGRVVNEWKSECTPALSAYLLPNGNLLRPGARGNGGFMGPGTGGRIQEFSWEGDVVWDFTLWNDRTQPHHDICRLPNGNVLIIAADVKSRDEALAMGRSAELVQQQLKPECILEIKPTGRTSGEIVWEWHAWDHLVQDADKRKPNFGDVSEHPELIDINFSNAAMDAMLADPQQLAKLRSLGYVGGGTKAPSESEKPENTPSERAPEVQDNPTASNAGPANVSSGKVSPGGDPRRSGPGGGMMGGDWMHVNSIAYNAKLDQIMVSVHEFSEVWIIDHATTTAESSAHAGGKRGKGGDLLYRWGNPKVYRTGSNADQRLFAQHCAHWIAEGLPGAGNMLVFNNGNQRPDGSYSSVDEIVLPLSDAGTYAREEFAAYGPERAEWTYAAQDKSSFYSMLISGAERLANGNTLICSGMQGLLLEVTSAGETVWQYKHPGAEMGDFGPRGERPGQLLPGFLQMILQLTGEQKTSLERLQVETDTAIAAMLTDEQKLLVTSAARGPMGGPSGGPGGLGGFRPPKPGEIFPAVVLESLKLNAQQRAQLSTLQQRVDIELAKIFNDSQKTQLKEMRKMFAGGGPPGFGPPGFGPPGFGPPGGGPVPGGRPGFGGPGAGGPGGLFRSYRYSPDYSGLVGKHLKAGKTLVEMVGN